MTTSGNFADSFSQIHQIVDRFAKENNISHTDAEQVLGSFYFNANVHGHAGTSGLLSKF